MARKQQRDSTLIRVHNDNLKLLRQFKGKKGGWNRALEMALHDVSTSSHWALPSQLYGTKCSARAHALELAVLGKLDYEAIEVPAKVRKV